MLEEAKVKDIVIKKLIQSGWNKDDILLDQRITLDGRLIQVDILLLYELFPLAIVEVKSPSNLIYIVVFVSGVIHIGL